MLRVQLLLLLFASVSLACPTWYIHVYTKYNSPKSGNIAHSVLEAPEVDAQRVLKHIAEWSAGEYAAKRIGKHNAIKITSEEVMEDRLAARKKNAETVKYIQDKIAI